MNPSDKGLPATPGDVEARRKLKLATRRGFLVGGVSALLGGGSLWWLASRPLENGLPWPLRRALGFNEGLATALFSESRLAPTFPESEAATAADMRVNGRIGLRDPIDVATWRLSVVHADGRESSFSLDDVRAVPKTSLVTEIKCIEGWSQIVSWSGPALRDFMTRHRLGTRSGAVPDFDRGRADLYRYVSIETPDKTYFVGLDIDSAIHPQTLLCHEMGGEPLTPDHGAPLRLAIPVKYGIKNIKRIGRITFTDERPADYWAERGYDWYAGH